MGMGTKNDKNKKTSFFERHFRWILILCILIVPIITTIYRQYKLSHNIDYKKAVITRKYIQKRVNKRWYQMEYTYIFHNKDYSSSETISEKTYNNVKIGDTITIIVNIDNPKISRWSEQNMALK